MSAGKHNIEITKGKTFRQRVQILDGEPSTPIATEASVAADIAADILIPRDLTGCTFTAKASDGSSVHTFAVTAVDAVEGIVEISYTYVQTALINWTQGVWDMTIIYPSTDHDVVLEGTVHVSTAVS